MKRAILALVAAMMATVMLSGCWWGWDHDRRDGYRDRDRDRMYDRDYDRNRDGDRR